MKKRTFALTASAILVGLITVGVSTLQAQPPGRGGPEGRGGRGGPDGHGPPPSPVMEALDINGDHVIDAEEIKMASQSLAKLDKNGDGELGEEEMHGPPPRGERGGERGGRPEGMRGPRDGQQERGGPRDGDRGRGPGGPDGPRGGGGPGGGMQDPARFVDHALEYDANDDGMLSRDELMAFAKEMPQHRRGGPDGGAERGGPGRGGPERGGPERGGPERGGAERGAPDRADRPDRPRRPSSDE